MKSISKYKNYILKDPFLDFMNKNGSNLGYKRDDFYSNFDKELLLDTYIYTNKQKFIEKIKNSIGVEFQEYDTNIGKIDLIMKTIDLKKHFKNYELYPGNNYSIFTIEYSTINISKKDNCILDSPIEQKYYKFKNWMLKEHCLKNNIKIDYSFILGRCYKGITSGFDLLFENKSSYADLKKEIDEHLNKIETNGYRLGKNIFPNMKNKIDFPWHSAKKKISERIKEITMIKGMSDKDRDKYVNKGLTSYKDLNLDVVKNQKKIFNTLGNSLPHNENMLFIDFEILTSIYDDFTSFPYSNKDSCLFMIGCGYLKRNNFSFKSFVAHNISEEKLIITKFIDFINQLPGTSCMMTHWTHIEKTLLLKKIEEYGFKIDKEVLWFDLYKYFSDNEILVKGCFTYKLKHVARALEKSKLIKSKWDNTFSDGLGAMTGYLKYLRTKNKKIIDDITHYNLIDCKVLWEIYKLL